MRGLQRTPSAPFESHLRALEFFYFACNVDGSLEATEEVDGFLIAAGQELHHHNGREFLPRSIQKYVLKIPAQLRLPGRRISGSDGSVSI